MQMDSRPRVRACLAHQIRDVGDKIRSTLHLPFSPTPLILGLKNTDGGNKRSVDGPKHVAEAFDIFVGGTGIVVI